jgi:hypothetical protein
MKKKTGTKIKVGGVKYTCYLCADPRALDPDVSESRGIRWGETDFFVHTLRLYNSPTDRPVVAVAFYHELVHAIVNEYHIKNMREVDDPANHNEDAVDLMAVGLKEAMESLGINILDHLKK